jgi:hypothetical protein
VKPYVKHSWDTQKAKDVYAWELKPQPVIIATFQELKRI